MCMDGATMTEPPGQDILFALGFCDPLGNAASCVALHMPVLLPKDCNMDRKELT